MGQDVPVTSAVAMLSLGVVVVPWPEFNALALEYKRIHGTAVRDLNVFDLVNNPTANGVCRVLGLGFEEQGGDGVRLELGPLLDHRPDPLLTSQDRPHMLAK